METQGTAPIVGEMILWARMGGYSTLTILTLSVIITMVGFAKRAMVVACTFLLISITMVAYLLLFRSGHVLIGMHVAQIGKILPYALILWMLAKTERNDE